MLLQGRGQDPDHAGQGWQRGVQAGAGCRNPAYPQG